MNTSLIVLSSDSINRYGFAIALEALEDIIFEYSFDGRPSNIGHDMHRPLGWMFPIGLFLEPGLTRLVGEMHIPNSEAENKDINIKHQNELYKRHVSDIQEHLSTLKESIADHIIGDETTFHCGCTCILNENIVKRVFSDLVNRLDKDGLIYLSDLSIDFEYIEQGAFKHKELELVIFAHPFFRRSMSRYNNLHSFFLDELLSHQGNSEITVRIALDWDLIGTSIDYKPSVELEFWYGPKFEDNIESIKTGVTKHVATEYEQNYYGILSTEFSWKNDADGQVFEMEELPSKTTAGLSGEYGCRYIHSIYDVDSKTFNHFDGAVKTYSSEAMDKRLTVSFDRSGRRAIYKKLFRIDGKLLLQDWKSLITNYYQGNPLIHEYFGEHISGMDENAKRSPLVQPPESISKIPYSFEKSQGVRVMISYHETGFSSDETPRIVTSHDRIDFAQKSYGVIEYDFIEIIKSLERLGSTIELPKEFEWIHVQDGYWNIPNIHHGKNNTAINLALTLKALRILISKIVQKRQKRTISFTISFPLSNKIAQISVAGKAKEILRWLDKNNTIPITHDSFITWLIEQRRWLSSYGNISDVPSLFDLVQSDGMLFFKRQSVLEPYDLKMDEDKIMYDLHLSDDQFEMAENIRMKKCMPVMALLKPGSTCSKSNIDYEESRFSKILDDDVSQIINKGDLIGLIWTDLPVH